MAPAAAQLPLALDHAPSPAALARASTSTRAPAAYEAGAITRRTVGWRVPTSSANDALLGSLGTIRDRSRQAVRNNGAARAALDALVSNVIGDGIKPLSKAADPGIRAAVQDAFARWTDECDADGRLEFYGLQALAVRTWFEGGESFTRLRPRLPGDGLTVPLQLQVLEPELCPFTYNGVGGTKVRAGIEFDALGQRVGFYFHPSRPELDDFDTSQLRRVAAAHVVHLFEAVRPGQLRGLPRLTQALIKLHELDKFDDATLLRQQLQNLFVAFITNKSGVAPDETINPISGQARAAGTPDPLTMEPGILQELDPGEEVQFSNPPGAPTAYNEYWRAQLRGAALAAGVPYEVLTGDMSQMNDRTVRVVLNQFKRTIGMLQHQVVAFQFCRPIWLAWFERAVLAGVLPISAAAYRANPTAYHAVKWTPPRWAYLHPVQDVEADVAAARAGFTTRADIVSEWGEDIEVVDAGQAADNARADRLGLQYSSDGRVPTAGPSASAIADAAVGAAQGAA